MNQILLQVLSQDPLKTPGVCLSFRWLVPLIPHLELLSRLFTLPLLGTWLGHVFLDTNDLMDQTFSLTGMLYVSTFISMIPKPNTSSKLWLDDNLFTLVCYVLYFAELALLAYTGLLLEYSVGWFASIAFSTTLTFLFYGLLFRVGLSSFFYFKTIVTIYLLTDLGNVLALGLLSSFDSSKIFIILGVAFLIYLLLPYRHPLLFSRLQVSPSQFYKNLTILRCLFWGALSVWADYIALTPFYILEMILASESHKRKDSVLYYLRQAWNTHRKVFWGHVKKTGNALSIMVSFVQTITAKKRIIFKEIHNPIHPNLFYPNPQRTLYYRNL